MVEKTPAGRMTELSLLSGKEIDYKLICTEGAVHLPTFTMKGIFNGLSAEGKASNKKVAKQKVANELLKLLQNQPQVDQLPGLEKVLEGWNYDDILSGERNNLTAHSNTVLNAVGALYEFQAKTKEVQVVFKPLDPQEEEKDRKKIFRIECTLNGHIDEKTGKPLVGIGSAIQKQESKRRAAEVVAQALVEQGLLDAITLKVVEDLKIQKGPETHGQRLLVDMNEKLDLKDFLVSNLSDNQAWTTARAGNLSVSPQSLLSQPENCSIDEIIGSKNDMILKQDVKGSFEKLCAKLERIGKKVVVNTLTKQADEVVHSIILVVKPKELFSVIDFENPSWVGQGLDIDTAKDFAAYKGLRHFGWDESSD